MATPNAITAALSPAERAAYGRAARTRARVRATAGSTRSGNGPIPLR